MSKPIRTPDTSTEVKITNKRAQRPQDPGNQSKLPHERDQSIDSTRNEPHTEMKQAYKDVSKGLKDTDERAKDGRPVGSKIPTK